MKPSKSILVLSLALATSAGAADADTSVPNFPTFISQAAQTTMAEIEVGKLALSKSNDPIIRGFAERMVKDHGATNAELTALAMSRGVIVPQGLDTSHQAMVQSLEATSETEFNREYARHMNMDHSKAIALFEGASLAADPDMASFAKKTLPKLKEHKKLAEKLPGASQAGSPPAG
jgi:putative membrane protein